MRQVSQLLACFPTFGVLSVSVRAQQSFTYSYDAAGQLHRVVDSSNTQLTYVYDEVGNITAIERVTLDEGPHILGFSPARGGVGTLVTVQGNGFAAEPGDNAVSFNGAATSAVSVNASGTSLTVLVPAGATPGPIAVTVAAETATSEESFEVLATPVVASVTPRYLFPGEPPVDVIVSGYHLGDATFRVEPEVDAPLALTTLAQADTTATLQVTIATGAVGSFVLVATGPGGDSGLFSDASNTLHVLDPDADPDFDDVTNRDERSAGTDPFSPDSDGDGFSDAFELGVGSDPLAAASVPDLSRPGDAMALAVSMGNSTVPPGERARDAISLSVSIGNSVPPTGAPVSEATSRDVSVMNSSP